jgi:hypothetical protein
VVGVLVNLGKGKCHSLSVFKPLVLFSGDSWWARCLGSALWKNFFASKGKLLLDMEAGGLEAVSCWSPAQIRLREAASLPDPEQGPGLFHNGYPSLWPEPEGNFFCVHRKGRDF